MALSLCQFSKIHENKLGFLIGSGPSLRFIQPDLLSPYVTMTINSSISFKNDCDYFTSDDWAISNWSYYVRDLANSKCTKFLYNKKFNGKICHLKNYEVCMFDHTWYYDPRNGKYNMDGLIVSDDCMKPIIGARTSLASGLHIMHLMGCNPIVLLGCDGQMEGDKRYFWEFPGFCKQARLDRKAREPVKVKKQIGDKECGAIKDYWYLFSKMNVDINDKIINCSNQSAIKEFSIMNFDEIISKYGERKK